MKKSLALLLSWLLLLPLYSQSSFPNDELILIMQPGATNADLSNLLDELDMHIIDGPTNNFGAMLLKYNTPPQIPLGTNVNGPITGSKKGANNKSSVTSAGFNYALSDFSSSSETHQTLAVQEQNCYDILDPLTQQNGGNPILAGIFDTGISIMIDPNNGFFDPSDLGHNMINPALGPKDDNGHGSHVSSIVMNNLENANSAIQLKAFKTHDGQGQGKAFDVIKALDQAISDGVQIVNMSFGFTVESTHTYEPKTPLKWCIAEALNSSGMLIVAAAGNANDDNDFDQQLVGLSVYPSSYNLPNVISVASANCTWQKSAFSNYGVISVDVFAPGENIWGYNQYWNLINVSGTSQATAFVTKLAIYLGTFQSQFDWQLTKCAILESAIAMNETGWVATDAHIHSIAALNYFINGDCSEGASYKMKGKEKLVADENISIISTEDNLIFELSADADYAADIFVSNVNGTVLSSKVMAIREGRNQYKLAFKPQVEFGIYFLSIKNQDGIRTVKFIR